MHSFLNIRLEKEAVSMEMTSTLQKSTNNKLLFDFINDTTNELFDAKEIAEVEVLFDKVIEQPFQIKFDNFKCWMLSSGFALLGCTYLYNVLNSRFYRWDWIDLFSIVILLVGVLWPIGLINQRSRAINRLNDLFISKTLDLLYRIKPSSSQFINSIESKFVDFARGNYSQNVSWCRELEFNCENQKIKVNALQHHYVVERIVEEKVSNGRGGYKTVKKKVYDNYYREGIVFPPLADFNSLVISHNSLFKKYNGSFKPSSIVFDKNFHVMTESEFSAAKFLKPTVVLAFEKLSTEFNGLTFEIAPDGSILINQEQTGILNSNLSSSIANPTVFKQDVLKNLTLNNVNIMFAFMNNLIKHLGK